MVSHFAPSHQQSFSWKSIPGFRELYWLIKLRAPGQLIIQYTDKCNAACPQCNMRASAPFKRSKLSIDGVKRIIDHAAAQGVAALSITGGEPLLYLKDVCALLRHANLAGIRFTRTGTNGFLFIHAQRPDFERRITQVCEQLLASGIYSFWISIDSANVEIHECMRGLPGVVAGIERALPIFHQHGLYPSVNLGINRNVGDLALPASADAEAFHRHFHEAFQRFYERVIDLGITIVNACYPMSVPQDDSAGLNAVYQASADDAIVQFSDLEKSLIFQALYDTIPEYRHKIRIFSPRTSLRALARQYQQVDRAAFACRGGIDFFFVDARDGDTYPCGYRGQENLGKFWDLDIASRDTKAHCTQCDWERFRDPSEIFGAAIGLFSDPKSWLHRMRQDPEYLKLWWEDIRYMRACGYFNARLTPRYERLAVFKQT
jgi:MoaA/NifB/PqqE/SkfB family radical SAM enzyme